MTKVPGDPVPTAGGGLLAEGCTSKPGKGDHEKWYCPCGEHMAVVTKPGTVSPGVVADTIKKMACLPKGWLQ